ncbi:MAG: hypothetical protein PHE17_08400 [Thiothrix sp.]|jgi:hypothetical protein|uniref:hypothetical protein n=1 Tax=Thiothrix sp. TaxID=1032 RepID=UPI00262FF839|nr:hypothetical protein [Thiothrix sp.]MDD5393021.1 hypothetical protein [Thiothrix sp.]
MKNRSVLGLLFFFSLNAAAFAGETHTWYAGTTYTGSVETSGLVWECSGGTCVLTGPYGKGLNMAVCQELSAQVGGLDYYYNDAGMTWSEKENKALLDQCNSVN